MRSTLLVWTVLGLLGSGLTSCMKSVDSQDEEQIVKNDEAILAYMGDSLKAVKQSSGYYFLTTKANPAGDSAKTGNEATVIVKITLLNKSLVLTDTTAFPMGINITGLYGLELAVQKMRTGEKAVALVPFYLAFGNVSRTNIPAYSPVRIDMELIKNRTEIQQIEDYIKEKKFVVTRRTSDNLFFIRTDTASGTPIGPGKSVSAKYVGRFLNLSKFDEGTSSFATGAGGTIKGFDAALQLLPPKGKAIAIFPSSIGYGASGRSPYIPGYTPLQFEIELQ